jgi:hypothetical protein
MIKNFKIFEHVYSRETDKYSSPQIDDYVIVDHSYYSMNPKIGQIILLADNKKYIMYDDKSVTFFNANKIMYWSKNREELENIIKELEIFINAKKYNL